VDLMAGLQAFDQGGILRRTFNALPALC
jgi:hypothetical protein